MKYFIDLLNNNQGVIDLIGLFVVIPFALMSDSIIERQKRRQQKKELKEILLKEFWMNINFVAQLEETYNNNIKDDKNIHVPYYSPRTEILDKYFQYDLLISLNKKEKEGFIEVYSQLENLKKEYLDWRTRLINHPEIVSDTVTYKFISSTMLTYINPSMTNLLDLWVVMVRTMGSKSNIKPIQDLNKILEDKIKQGKWIRTCYKSSYFNKSEYTNTPKFNVILCWEHDWPQADKEVIEVKNIIALHESWKKQYVNNG